MKTTYEQGDLVRWYEYYADGDIIRNGGVGIVLDNTAPVTGAIRSVNYRVKVFCSKMHSARWFHISEIELIKKGTYKPDKSIKKEI
jgi:hypothetical protein